MHAKTHHHRHVLYGHSAAAAEKMACPGANVVEVGALPRHRELKAARAWVPNSKAWLRNNRLACQVVQTQLRQPIQPTSCSIRCIDHLLWPVRLNLRSSRLVQQIWIPLPQLGFVAAYARLAVEHTASQVVGLCRVVITVTAGVTVVTLTAVAVVVVIHIPCLLWTQQTLKAESGEGGGAAAGSGALVPVIADAGVCSED
jgi:hypothetical protein